MTPDAAVRERFLQILTQRIGSEWLTDDGRIHPRIRETLVGLLLAACHRPAPTREGLAAILAAHFSSNTHIAECLKPEPCAVLQKELMAWGQGEPAQPVTPHTCHCCLDCLACQRPASS